MILSANTQAVLLLTVHFTKAAKDDVKPLTNREWGQFALWLKARNQTPEMLLVGDPASLLNEWRGEAVTLQHLEQLAGRQRPYRHAPRTLDLDLLLYGNASISSADLMVPHPRMYQRAFVLVPLAEIAPQRVAADDLRGVQSQRIECLAL